MGMGVPPELRRTGHPTVYLLYLTFRLYEKRDIKAGYEQAGLETVDNGGHPHLYRQARVSRRRGVTALDRHRQTDNASSIYLHELWFVAS